MKRLFILAVLFFCNVSSASIYGKELSPKVGSTGEAAFGLNYAYDVDRSWSLTFTSNLTSGEIGQLPQVLFWNVIDKKTNSPYLDWKQIGRSELLVSTFDVNEVTPLFKFLPNMKDSVVVISANKSNGLYYIDLKALCERYPINISDMSNTMNAKCVVNPSQLPDMGAECKNLTKQMGDYVKRGLLTCTIANNQLAKKGCAPLACS
jgi:hypothetical protein